MGLKPLAAGAALSSAASREQDKVGGCGEREREVFGVVPGAHCGGGSQAGAGMLRSGRCMGCRTLITRKPTSLILLGIEQLVGAVWRKGEGIYMNNFHV